MNDYEKRLYGEICRILTEYDERRTFSMSEWYDVLVQVQNCILAHEYKNR